MGVIVVVCAAFGLTVSEAKTEIICLTHEGDAGGTHHIPPNERVRIPGGTSTTTTPICPSRSTGTYATHGATSGSTPLNYTTDRAPPSSSISECQEPGLLETTLYGCVTWSSRVCQDDTLQRAHHSFLTRCSGRRENNRTDLPVSYYLDTLVKTKSESVDRR